MLEGRYSVVGRSDGAGRGGRLEPREGEGC